MNVDVCRAGLLDHVTVLIGIAVNGRAVAGVIHQPYYNYQAGPSAVLGRTIWAVVGLGNLRTIIICIVITSQLHFCVFIK